MNSRLFSQYRIDIKKLIRIATPIGLAQLAQTGMGTVDVIMAGLALGRGAAVAVEPVSMVKGDVVSDRPRGPEMVRL